MLAQLILVQMEELVKYLEMDSSVYAHRNILVLIVRYVSIMC